MVENGRHSVEEIHYYFRLNTANLAMASSYSDPDTDRYTRSYQTYWTARRLGNRRVFDISSIKSVVMMAPDPNYTAADGHDPEMWFLMPRPGVSDLA